MQQVFAKINPHLPVESLALCFEQVLSVINKPESLDLITNNRAFHRLLLEGVPVEYKVSSASGEALEEVISDHAFLIDFERLENNHFVVVNQFTITGTKQPRRLTACL